MEVGVEVGELVGEEFDGAGDRGGVGPGEGDGDRGGAVVDGGSEVE